jgi:hypothetical protein
MCDAGHSIPSVPAWLVCLYKSRNPLEKFARNPGFMHRLFRYMWAGRVRTAIAPICARRKVAGKVTREFGEIHANCMFGTKLAISFVQCGPVLTLYEQSKCSPTLPSETG